MRLSRLGFSGLLACWLGLAGRGGVVFETTSPYHHIRVVDQGGLRLLTFDKAVQTRMALADPLRGHFEYTEYFHLPWLWNPGLTNVLMLGLGGGSAQRAWLHYYPAVRVDTVEIDPVVVRVAQQYFGVRDSPRHRVHVEDGRQFLRRYPTRYGAILVDAYTHNRYGAFIPAHLATREFFTLAAGRLTDDGVLAYNVVATWEGPQSELLGAVYRTLRTVFPHVYAFPARESLNVVLIGTRASTPRSLSELQQRAGELVRTGRVTLPTFLLRVQAARLDPPPSAATAPVLTDDFAPVDRLLAPRW